MELTALDAHNSLNDGAERAFQLGTCRTHAGRMNLQPLEWKECNSVADRSLACTEDDVDLRNRFELSGSGRWQRRQPSATILDETAMV